MATRYKGVEIEIHEPGNFYLVHVEHLNDGWQRWELCDRPGRTNMSHETTLRGWLGSFNNVSRTAHGCVRVTRTKAGRWRIAPITDAEMLASEETGA